MKNLTFRGLRGLFWGGLAVQKLAQLKNMFPNIIEGCFYQENFLRYLFEVVLHFTPSPADLSYGGFWDRYARLSCLWCYLYEHIHIGHITPKELSFGIIWPKLNSLGIIEGGDYQGIIKGRRIYGGFWDRYASLLSVHTPTPEYLTYLRVDRWSASTAEVRARIFRRGTLGRLRNVGFG